MLRRIVIVVALIALCFEAVAQQDSILVVGKDTVGYRYTPMNIAVPSNEGALPVDTLKSVSPAVRRVLGYFLNSSIDRSFEKKIDFTLIPAPYYSNSTSVGLALLAAGIYRIDRQNRSIPPSNISIYANASITGYYRVGVKNTNIFRDNRNRLDCNLEFRSLPTRFWGLGYRAATENRSTEYLSDRYHIDVRYMHRFFKSLYLGASVSFNYFDSRRVTTEMLSYLEGRAEDYLGTGLSLIVGYDSRDNTTAPQRGVYIGVSGTVRPAALGDMAHTSYAASVTINYYQRLWRGGLLAFDLYGEYNSEATPWMLYPTLGGTHRMRGYYEGQFSDCNAVMLQVELRQRIWRQLGCVVWGGAGNVFRSFDSFEWKQTMPNYGLGLRWELKKNVHIRLDYGFGGKVQGKILNGCLFSINEAF